MIESPLSRFEFKLLLGLVIVVLVTGGAYWGYSTDAEATKAAAAQGKVETRKLKAGFHLVKMNEQGHEFLRMLDCIGENKCSTLGFRWNPNDPADVKDAEATYQLFQKPVDPPQLVEVIH